MIRIIANATYFDPLPQEREHEEMTFQKPYDDKELKRKNPKRYDQRTDWTILLNEKGHDSDVSNRYSSLPFSVLVYKIEKLCENPTKKDFLHVQELIRNASRDVKASVYDYVINQISLIETEREYMNKFSSESIIRYYILCHIF